MEGLLSTGPTPSSFQRHGFGLDGCQAKGSAGVYGQADEAKGGCRGFEGAAGIGRPGKVDIKAAAAEHKSAGANRIVGADWL